MDLFIGIVIGVFGTLLVQWLCSGSNNGDYGPP